jgi:hypothetical protein
VGSIRVSKTLYKGTYTHTRYWFFESLFCHPNFVRERLLLAAQEESFAALKEEGSAHPLLRGAGNTAEGFEVHRANFCIFFFP